MNSSSASALLGCRTPFTAAQWQELEHQALIFKYLIAGVPVPPELLAPIRRSFEALPGRYFHHPATGYYSYYGRKIDPEPGRCRRTDGKKWRCSKDAYPDSKYCERHMHRGRNRSRKPVESQTASQTHSSSSNVTSLNPVLSGSLQTIPLNPVQGHGNAHNPCISGSSSHLTLNPGPFTNRYSTGLKPTTNDLSFFSETSGSSKGIGVNLLGDTSLGRESSLLLSKAKDSSLVTGSYPVLQPVPDLGQVTVSSYPRQHQHSLFGCEFNSTNPARTENQPLHSFFDEWPKTREPWSDVEEDISNRKSFSTTQLSISIPMASSDFSATSSLSANGDN